MPVGPYPFCHSWSVFAQVHLVSRLTANLLVAWHASHKGSHVLLDLRRLGTRTSLPWCNQTIFGDVLPEDIELPIDVLLIEPAHMCEESDPVKYAVQRTYPDVDQLWSA